MYRLETFFLFLLGNAFYRICLPAPITKTTFKEKFLWLPVHKVFLFARFIYERKYLFNNIFLVERKSFSIDKCCLWVIDAIDKVDVSSRSTISRRGWGDVRQYYFTPLMNKWISIKKVFNLTNWNEGAQQGKIFSFNYLVECSFMRLQINISLDTITNTTI